MRSTLLLLPLLTFSAPGVAQAAMPFEAPSVAIPPAAADRVAGSLHALTDALLSLRVGELKAAVEGHPATAAERHLTIGELAARDDPEFRRKLHRRIAEAAPAVRNGIEAVNRQLPAVVEQLHEAGRSIDRAIANMPDPTYPKR